jgi:ribosomal protein S18 acetylase RimI-like enzyme
VGYLLASFVFSLEHGGWMAEIDEFYVAEGLRGSGIGAALIDVATADMRAAGLVRIQLQLGNLNENGRHFYERHGYRRRDGFQLWDRPL